MFQTLRLPADTAEGLTVTGRRAEISELLEVAICDLGSSIRELERIQAGHELGTFPDLCLKTKDSLKRASARISALMPIEGSANDG